MKLLLDTHAFLWWVTDDEALSGAARTAIADESNIIFVSAATAWEIATKVRLGKLDQAAGACDRFTELIAADGFSLMPIEACHALKAGSYRVPHRDPFDRMLAAQSAIEGIQLLTRDPAFKQFGTDVYW
ncbi:type II toxin-antitoxin system VapC family toxin [bacterium]|nr:type II toxin-antitoxin system VapC family toxin [bacterium]